MAITPADMTGRRLLLPCRLQARPAATAGCRSRQYAASVRIAPAIFSGVIRKASSSALA
jgi:hypothetical protein